MGRKFDKKYDITYSTEVEQKHFPWAKPFINGKIKAFFVPGVRFGREIAELAQRTDIAYETVTIDRDWDLNQWGFGEFYHLRGGIWDFGLMYENLENAMNSEEEFDVMVLPGLNGWGHFPEQIREKILERVEKGTGLVLIKPFNGKTYDNREIGAVEELEKLSPLKNLFEEGFVSDRFAGEGFPEVRFDLFGRDRWLAEKHYITEGIPFELFPYKEMAYYPYEAKGQVILRSESGMPVAAVKEYGKGRIAAFGYYPRNILPQHGGFTGRECFYDSIVDFMGGAKHGLTFNYLEYFYALLYRAMIWAARKEPQHGIREVAASGGRIEVKADGDENYGYSLRVVDSYDHVVHRDENPSGVFALPDWLALGGQYRADVFAALDGKITDWRTKVLHWPSLVQVKSIKLNSCCLKPGDELIAGIETAGGKGELEIQVLDDFDRMVGLYHRQVEDDDSITVIHVVDDVKALHLRVHAILRIDGHIVQRRDSDNVVITPQERRLNDFEVFMNAQNRGQGDFWKLQRDRDLELGVTGLFPGSTRMHAMSGAEGLGIYFFHRYAYIERKEKYLKSKAKKDLYRLPCLNDPEFWKQNEKDIEETVGKYMVFGPVAYYANDEGSVTCYRDELDLCFCPDCMRGMRQWLKTIYRSLDELNREWGTAFASWEEVEPYTYEEAVDTRQFASWADHRTFMEDSFVNAYRRIKEYINRTDPDGIIRMSGCQASTAYSGYDYYKLHQHIGYFEAYFYGNQYELHRSFARPDTILAAWVGYGARGRIAHNRIWNCLYHNITLISLFSEYSMMNPDFTYYSGAVDLAGTLKEIRREGIGKLLLYSAKRDTLGIAIHYSMPSIHGAYLMGSHSRYDSNRESWCCLLEDLGYQYDFIANLQIEDGELMKKGYKLLILPYAISVSPKEADAIRCFVRNGGIVIGDFQTGVMDQHCRLYKKGSLDDVFGIVRMDHFAKPFYIDNSLKAEKDFPYFTYRFENKPGIDLGFSIAEAGIRMTSGKAAFTDSFLERVGVVVVNGYGSGKGIYLNLCLDKYVQLRLQGDEACHIRGLAGRILDFCGIGKPCKMLTRGGQNVDTGYETFYYRDGSARYVGILRSLGWPLKANYDGLEDIREKQVSKEPESLKLLFDAAAHVYDIRRKKYLGYTDSIEAAFQWGDTGVFSLLPYKVEGVEILGEDTAQRGKAFALEARLKTGKAAGEYTNVFSIGVFNPSGKYEWMYSGNISTGDLSFRKEYKLPYNAERGRWRITVKDVATGVSAEKEIMVE